MEQYISKSALVAEIEKYYNECLKRAKITDSDYWNAKADAYRNVLTILDDTLEVKEVDNVWHDASETPKGAGDKEILVQFVDSHASVFEIDDWEYLDHQTKWAYLKDLI